MIVSSTMSRPRDLCCPSAAVGPLIRMQALPLFPVTDVYTQRAVGAPYKKARKCPNARSFPAPTNNLTRRTHLMNGVLISFHQQYRGVPTLFELPLFVHPPIICAVT